MDRRAEIYFPWNFEILDGSAIGFDALIYNLGTVRIGRSVTISQRAHVCAGTHDFRDPLLPLLKPKVVIQDQAWICADAFVGPGVEIGHDAVVGARAVVTKDVPPFEVVAGNPAKGVSVRRYSSPDNGSLPYALEVLRKGDKD